MRLPFLLGVDVALLVGDCGGSLGLLGDPEGEGPGHVGCSLFWAGAAGPYADGLLGGWWRDSAEGPAWAWGALLRVGVVLSVALLGGLKLLDGLGVFAVSPGVVALLGCRWTFRLSGSGGGPTFVVSRFA